MEEARIVFESYNRAVEESYNSLFEMHKPEELLNIKEGDVEFLLKARIKEWEDTPIKELNGVTAREYFSGLSDFEVLVEHIKQAALLCDEKLPDLLLEKFRSFGERAVDVLLDLAIDSSQLKDEDNFLIPLTAVNILGEWRIERAVDPLLHMLCSLDEEDEAIAEGVGHALVRIGEAAVSPIVSTLENVKDIGYVRENLISALSAIGRDYKSDMVFKCLKNEFLSMENKIIGAICLAEYGDGRAIPALRGYVAKNIDTIDSETYYGIKSAVEELGGSMEDLQLNFEEEK